MQGVWLLVLAGGYLVERVACLAGLPYDCIREVGHVRELTYAHPSKPPAEPFRVQRKHGNWKPQFMAEWMCHHLRDHRN